MKKSNIFIGIVIGIALVFSGWMILSLNKISQYFPSLKTETFSPEIRRENIEKRVFLTIDDSQGTLKTFDSEFNERITAFDLLKNKTEKSGLTLKTKTYDIGVLIEAIGDKENGENGKYWLYYVNGEMPMVSVDKKELNPGDKVEFKFEKSPF